jgi:hypothetical protein
LPGRVAEVVVVSALATIVTAAIAAPVLRAPSERLFGMEIVGRHHDPFTVIDQFAHPIGIGMYSQPVTDVTGTLIARLSGAVAAYNWLILLTFPLSAAAAYLLARYLALAPAGAALAAIAYAFSPFHVAQAAYHPHIAQTQWLPLYLLALWRCLDDASPLAIAFLGAATLGVTLSNFYGGFIAAVITPAAVAAYWLTRRHEHGSMRRLGLTVGSLVLIAACGVAYTSYAARAVVSNRAAFAFPRTDLFGFSATWLSYLVPPVAHPLIGATVRRVWAAEGVRAGLLEQQVSLGWGILALAIIAVVRWLRDRPTSAPCPRCFSTAGRPCACDSDVAQPFRAAPRGRRAGLKPCATCSFLCGYGPLVSVPVLVIVGVTALVCSLSPEQSIGPFTLIRPSSLLYDVVPMFRAYARFGVAVQLMAALLAGVGVDQLRRAGTLRAQIVCLALVAVAAAEYAVAPSALWRDVLPTTAHRWVMQQADGVRVLDCAPLNQESASVQWLTRDRVSLRSPASDCEEPHFPERLAATGYTHLLVRGGTADGEWFAAHPALDGLRVAARFRDGQVFTITASTPALYTAAMTGFFPREHDRELSWRWMGADASWTIVNTGARPIVAALGLDMSAFHVAREMALRLDGQPVQTLVVEPSRHIYQIGPLTVPPGDHTLAFHAAEAPDVAGDVIDNRDPRRLSFALGTWTWSVQEDPR